MSSTILFSIVALVGVSLGCTRRSDQLSGFGKILSPKGRWNIELLEVPPGLRITEGNGATHVRSPVAWTNGKAAFVYVDNDERIWAFDGGIQTFIFEKVRESEYSASSLANWKHPIPVQFNAVLPYQLRRQAEQVGGGNGG